MCGITGVMFEIDDKTANKEQFIEDIKDIFTTSLLGIVGRGRESTGAALLKKDGSMVVVKDHFPAELFTESVGYEEFRSYINEDIIGIIGHTRQHTQGPPANNLNNHPHVCGRTIGVHNGSIRNDDEKMKRFKLKTAGLCDSEAIFRLYDWAREKLVWSRERALKLVYEQLKGSYACAMFSGWDHRKLILFKNWGALNIARLEHKGATKHIFMFNSEFPIIRKAVEHHQDIIVKEHCATHALDDNSAFIVDPNTNFETVSLK